MCCKFGFMACSAWPTSNSWFGQASLVVQMSESPIGSSLHNWAWRLAWLPNFELMKAW